MHSDKAESHQSGNQLGQHYQAPCITKQFAAAGVVCQRQQLFRKAQCLRRAEVAVQNSTNDIVPYWMQGCCGCLVVDPQNMLPWVTTALSARACQLQLPLSVAQHARSLLC